MKRVGSGLILCEGIGRIRRQVIQVESYIDIDLRNAMVTLQQKTGSSKLQQASGADVARCEC